MAGAAGDTKRLFERLDEVAPEDIHVDVERIVKWYDSLDSSDGSFEGIVAPLAGGLEVLPSWNRVQTYIDKNCGSRSTSS